MDILGINFEALAGSLDANLLHDSSQWLEWRLAYEGGEAYLHRHLKIYSEHETQADFARRRSLTPIPAYAKREVNRVKNALFQRFGDIVRRGGSPSMTDAIEGTRFGIDRRGSSVNAFLGKHVLPELLPMSKVGVLVDAPRFAGGTLADVPEGWRPYVYTYPVERIPFAIPADPESQSDWKVVCLRDQRKTADLMTGKFETIETLRFYFLNEDTGRVNVKITDTEGQEIEPVIELPLTEIPFVLFDIGDSLLKDAASYQIALMNLISSDTNYAVHSNFPFLVRQRGNDNAGSHLRGEGEVVEAGASKGIWYEKNMNAPAFIGPPTAPMLASLELRREMKEEIRELVSGAVEALGEEGTIDSGLAFIGLCLEHGENRVWDHWAAYESTEPTRRKRPTLTYPSEWSIKTDAERIEEAGALAGTIQQVPGNAAKKEISKLVADKLLLGKITAAMRDKIHKEIEAAPYCTSDPEIIIPAKKEGLISAKHGAMALGGDENEYKLAEEDQARRAAAIVAAQADEAAARGNPDGSVTPGQSASLEREGAADRSAKLGGDDDAGVRGKGQ